MKVLLLLLLALLSAVAAAWFSQAQGGELILHSGEWTVRMSVLVALLGLIVTCFGLYLAAGFLYGILALPYRLRGLRHRRRQNRAETLYRKAMRETLEYRFAEARKSLARAADLSPESSPIHLLAASVCMELRDWEHWEKHLQAVTDPECREAALLLRLRGLLATDSWEEAMAILLEQPTGSPEPVPVVRARMRCLSGMRHWKTMLQTAGSLSPGDGLEEGEIRDWCLRAARERVDDTTPEQLPGLWEEFPEAVRGNPELLDLYAHALRSAEIRNDDLEKHVCAKAEQEFDPSWTAVCARLPGPVSRDLLPRARQWLSRNPGLPQLVLLCARLHMRAGEWDQARTLFEELPPHPQDASVHRDLVRTLLMLGEDRAAVHSMRSASPSAGDAA